MKKVRFLFFCVVAALAFASCEKTTSNNQATGDVFIKSIVNSQGQVVYAAIHSVFSYNTMTSVVVTDPAGRTSTLLNYQNAGNSFYNDPTESEFSSSVPLAGVYTYAVTFTDGQVVNYQNTLSSSTILPANIISLAKNTAGDSVYFSWNAIANVTAYQLVVKKGDTQVLYQPAFVDGNNPPKPTMRVGYKVSNFGPGTFSWELSGLLFENSDYVNLQALSSVKRTIDL